MLNLRLPTIPHYTPAKLYSLALCCLLTATSAGCQAYGKNYFPLTDSARWEYSGSLTSPDGSQTPLQVVIRVDGQTLINNQRYFKFVISAGFQKTPNAPKINDEVRYYRVAQGGIYFLSSRDTSKPERIEIPLPIPLGVKWLTGTGEMQAERAGTMKAAGRGFRDCVKLSYRQADGAHRVDYYLAPDVGMIKVVDVSGIAPQSTTMEWLLDNYKI